MIRSMREKGGSCKILCCANTHTSRSGLEILYLSFDLVKNCFMRFGETFLSCDKVYSPIRAILIASALRSDANIWKGALCGISFCSSSMIIAIE